MGYLFYGAFISSANQIMIEKIYCQSTGANTPFQWQAFYQTTCGGTGTLQSCQNLDHCPIRNYYATTIHLPISRNLQTPWQMFLFLDLW